MTICVDAQLPPSLAGWMAATFTLSSVAVRDLGLREAMKGGLGRFPGSELMLELLAHAGKLKKMGAQTGASRTRGSPCAPHAHGLLAATSSLDASAREVGHPHNRVGYLAQQVVERCAVVFQPRGSL